MTHSMKHPMLFEIKNLKDGSRHLLLGTLHTGFRLHELFSSNFMQILESATTLIGEVKYTEEKEKVKPSFCPVLTHIHQRKYDLKKILGEDRLKVLQNIQKGGREASDHPVAGLARLVLKHAIEVNDLARIIEVLKTLGSAESTGLLQITIDQPEIIDRQIPAAASNCKDKLFLGLETLEDNNKIAETFYDTASSALAYNDPKVEWGIDRITEWLDNIGIAGESARVAKWVEDYIKGRILPCASPSAWWRPSYVNNTFYFEYIDKRNLAWIDTGTIQKSCVKGKKSLIYVGASHIYYYRLPLTTLIRKEGFSVESLSPEQFLKFNF